MDPISIGLQIAGLGMSLFGGGASLFGSKKTSELQEKIANEERLANQQRLRAMELSSRRQQIQNIRNVQLQRSMALTAATAQGAQFGTGLAGGIAQVNAEGAWNELGITQNTEIGRNMFAINDRISGLKAQIGETQSEMAMYQGLGSLGGSLMKAGPTIGALTKNAFGSSGGYNYGPDVYGGRYGYTSANYGMGYN